MGVGAFELGEVSLCGRNIFQTFQRYSAVLPLLHYISEENIKNRRERRAGNSQSTSVVSL